MHAHSMLLRPLACLALALPAFAHPGGPEPVLAYDFSKAAIVTGEKPSLKPRFGPTTSLGARKWSAPGFPDRREVHLASQKTKVTD